MIKMYHSNYDNINDLLRAELLKSFSVSRIEDLPENYGNSKNWSLLNIINDLDSYTLLYVDNNFWSGSGGRILSDNSYQACVRMFTNLSNLSEGLSRPAHTMNYSLPYQIDRARLAGCSRVIMTFNEHRYELFKAMSHNIISEKRNNILKIVKEFKASPHTEIINGVNQWILELKL